MLSCVVCILFLYILNHVVSATVITLSDDHRTRGELTSDTPQMTLKVARTDLVRHQAQEACLRSNGYPTIIANVENRTKPSRLTASLKEDIYGRYFVQ